MKFFGMMSIIKGEPLSRLDEWIRYHRRLGMERLIIFDNNEPDQRMPQLSYKDVLITQVLMPGRLMQMEAYRTAKTIFAHDVKWMAFMDADEFINPVGINLMEFLASHSREVGITMRWQIFGSNGLPTIESGWVTTTHILRTPPDYAPNNHVKCIVQPTQILKARDPHSFVFVSGKIAVNSEGIPVVSAFDHNQQVRLRLNHYFCRSIQEQQTKIKRGRSDHRNPYDPKMFEDANQRSTITDTTVKERVESWLKQSEF